MESHNDEGARVIPFPTHKPSDTRRRDVEHIAASLDATNDEGELLGMIVLAGRLLENRRGRGADLPVTGFSEADAPIAPDAVRRRPKRSGGRCGC
jgi:hypothetical protein